MNCPRLILMRTRLRWHCNEVTWWGWQQITNFMYSHIILVAVFFFLGNCTTMITCSVILVVLDDGPRLLEPATRVHTQALQYCPLCVKAGWNCTYVSCVVAMYYLTLCQGHYFLFITSAFWPYHLDFKFSFSVYFSFKAFLTVHFVSFLLTICFSSFLLNSRYYYDYFSSWLWSY
jgi:hypothetical protein